MFEIKAIAAVCSGLPVWAVLSGLSLRRGTQTLIAALSAATRRIQRTGSDLEFAQTYEEINADVARDPTR